MGAPMFNLKDFCSAHYCDSEEEFRILSAFFDATQNRRGQWVDLIGGERVIFDGFVMSDHECLMVLVRDRLEDVVSYKLHLSHFAEYQHLWEIEQAYKTHAKMEREDIKDAWEQGIQAVEPVCSSCNCFDPPIRGDDVYFGYCGPAVCPKCEEIADE
jgi:hypothetical protein